jgi:uncharacterized protein (TIGR02145 family)
MASSNPKPVSVLLGGALLTVAFLVVGHGQESDSGTIRDVEGNVYRTRLIGTQWWMAENLNVSHYTNGDSIPQVQDAEQWLSLTTGAWCYYDNNPDNAQRYGKLYNWHAVNDPRGLAPVGWHVPTEEEWKELETAMGMNSAVGDAQGWFGTPSGFRGLGGGFYMTGRIAAFWSSSDDAWDYAWYRALAANRSAIRRKLSTKMRGFSVRCVKDTGR